MQVEDFERFCEIMDEAGCAFFTKINFETKKVYFKHLSGATIEVIECAFGLAIKSCDSFPTISTIRKKADITCPDKCGFF